MEFDPEKRNCSALLFTHIAVKGAQTGSVLGAGAAGTSILYNMYKTGQTGPAMDIALTRTGTGFAYGLAAVSVLGAARMMQLDADGIQDRAYRLHYNEAQNRVDKFWMVGGIAGGLGSFLVYGSQKVLGGAALGGVVGVLAHVLTPMPKSKE